MSADVSLIRTRPASRCLLCGGAGKVLYADLPDRSYAAAGRWNIQRCLNSAAVFCGWILSRSRKISVRLTRATTRTTSLSPGPAWCGMSSGPSGTVTWEFALAIAREWVPVGSNRSPSWLFCILEEGTSWTRPLCISPRLRRGSRVLDVGCGSGVLLARMKSLGWEVEGVEVDPDAVESGGNAA